MNIGTSGDNSTSELLHTCLLKAVLFISSGLLAFINRKNEAERSARMGVVLLNLQCRNPDIFRSLSNQILITQQVDGGWRNVEETIWCIEALKKMGFEESVERGYVWLKNQRNTKGGWGQNSRDFARIPLTSLMLIFHKKIVEEKDIDWLIKEVKEEAFNNDGMVLTYKISLPIAAFDLHAIDFSQKKELLNVLIDHQNEDGGFGPWKNHPVKSEIISSAYAALVLAKEKNYLSEYSRCLKWIIDSQLSNGSWPYHYIDHGTAMGAFCIYNLLSGKNL